MLTHAEAERVVRATRSCYEISDLEGFIPHAATIVKQVMQLDMLSLCVVDLRTLKVETLKWTPEEIPLTSFLEAYTRACNQDVALAHYLSTFDKGLIVLSDLISGPELREHAIYTDCMALLKFEDLAYYELDINSASMSTLCVARGSEFSASEKAALRLLMPHLRVAYRSLLPPARPSNWMELGRIQRRFSMKAASDGRLLGASPETYRFLVEHGLCEQGSRPERLTGALMQYMREVGELFRSDRIAEEWIAPLRLEAKGWSAEAVCMPDARCETFTIVFRSEDGFDFALALMGRGLTKREAEVLYWVSLGKTNEDIAGVLDISPKTARLHVERILGKLGVDNRTAAVGVAMESLTRYYNL